MVTVLAGISLAIFTGMCLLALFKPHWAVVLIFCLFGYEQLLSSYISVFGQRTWILNVVVGVVALLAVTLMTIYGKHPFRGTLNFNSILVGCLILFAYAGFTYSRMPPAASYFIKSGFPYAALLLVLLPALIISAEQIRRMCIPLLTMGCALMLLILIGPRTVFYGMRMFIDLSYTQGGDTRGNPLAIAELGGLMVIVASLMGQDYHNILVKLIRLFAILLGISICFLAAARGQLVFSIFFSVLLYPVAYQIKNIVQFFVRAMSIGVVAGIAFVIAKLFLFDTESSARFSSENISEGFAGRLQMARTMMGEYLANPSQYLQGLGTGSYNAIVAHDGDNYLYPHNLIIEVVTHHGMIGSMLLAGIFFITATHTIKLIRLIPTGVVDRSSVAIVIALAGYWTLISMKQGSFLLIPIPFYMYLIISKLYVRSKLDLSPDMYSDDYLDYGTQGGEESGDYEDYGDYENTARSS